MGRYAALNASIAVLRRSPLPDDFGTRGAFLLAGRTVVPPAVANRGIYASLENTITAIPSTTRITPVARLSVFGAALLAKTAAIRAQTSVKITQSTHTSGFGMPPMAKCETAPVSAVNVMINTLVPTAVFSS